MLCFLGGLFLSVSGDESLVALYGEALDFARMLNEKLNTFHFLVAFFTAPSEVCIIFEEKGLSPKLISSTYREMQKQSLRAGSKLSEPVDIIPKLEQRSLSYIQNNEQPSALHFLTAITSMRETIAYRLLNSIGLLTDIRLRSTSLLSIPLRGVKSKVDKLFEESTFVSDVKPKEKKSTVETEEVVKEKEEKKSEISSNPKPKDKNKIKEFFYEFGRNLTELAKENKLEAVFGRSSEIESVLDILGRKKNNNPLIVGPSGCGKTALVEGLAQKQTEGLLPNKIIWELNLSSFLSGTEYRGSLEERVKNLIENVSEFKDELIVFIDEIHLLNSSGNKMISNMFKPVLARGDFPLIGATTPEEFKLHIASDPAMERRFTIINIEEPKGEQLFAIVKNATKSLGEFHNVKMDDKYTIESAILLSNRYISGKSQPDKVLSLLDTVGSVLGRSNKKVVENSDLMEQVSSITKIPIENLLIDGHKIMQVLPEKLNNSIKGQKTAKKQIIRLLARRFKRKSPSKPLASFVFAGPTGVGKTETAKKLAEFFFGSEKRMTVFDMSEFQEQHSVSRLIGAPPGYSGYEEGGKLTEAFRREPYQLLLLDEIEKAHPKVLTLLLQILEEGRISDTRGFSVNMTEAIIVLTTNLGAEVFSDTKVGFGGEDVFSERMENDIFQKIQKFLSPELVNRVDEVVVFKPFSTEEFEEITKAMLLSFSDIILDSYNTKISFENIDDVAKAIVSSLKSREKAMGARIIKRKVEKLLESEVLERIYKGNFSKELKILTKNNEIVLESVEKIKNF